MIRTTLQILSGQFRQKWRHADLVGVLRESRIATLSLLVCLLLGFCLAACQGPPAPPQPRPRGTGLEATDPCAMRLHDICGPMLMYYTLHKRLPETLEELQPLADLDTDVKFVCPLSGKPYIYHPADLNRPGPATDRRMILFDATAAHNGLRWSILAAPAEGDQPLTLWVVPLDQHAFESLQPTPPPR